MCAGRSDALSPANKRLDLTNPGPGASRRPRSDVQVSRQTFGGRGMPDMTHVRWMPAVCEPLPAGPCLEHRAMS
jgi:hypothetical protein